MKVVFTAKNKKPLNLKKRPLLFLGRWCFLNENDFAKNKHKTISYKLKKRKELLKQYNLEKKLYEKILKELSHILNKLHKINFPIRAWRIIIGPWLNRFVTIILDRNEIIEKLKRKVKINGEVIFKRKIKNYIASDTHDFTQKASSDEWNDYIFHRILILKTKLKKNVVFEHKISKSRSLFKLNFTNKVLNFINNKKLNKKKFILHNSYLGKKNVLKLFFQLKELPFKPFFNYQIDQRQNLERIRNKITFEKKNVKNKYENLIKTLVIENLPSIYVENFKSLLKLSKSLDYKSKSIFSCNGIYKNELFKCWAALAIQEKSKIFCGQHGGTYGISLFSYAEDHELKISDYFLSWGWKIKKNKKIIPYSSMKILNTHKLKDNNTGKILIVINRNGRYLLLNQSERIDFNTAEEYTKFILDFLKKIPKFLRKKITLKLYPNENEYLNPIKPIILKEFGNEYKILDDQENLRKKINDFELVVLTNNNTSFLEMIGVNKPCVLLVNKKISFIRNAAIKDFAKLSKVKIYHVSIKSCVKHVLKIHKNIKKWWDDKDTLKSKNSFTKKFVRNDDKDLKKLAQILKNV